MVRSVILAKMLRSGTMVSIPPRPSPAPSTAATFIPLRINRVARSSNRVISTRVHALQISNRQSVSSAQLQEESGGINFHRFISVLKPTVQAVFYAPAEPGLSSHWLEISAMGWKKTVRDLQFSIFSSQLPVPAVLASDNFQCQPENSTWCR